MADSGAIRAGRAFVELFAEDSKLVRGLNSAQGKFQSWGAKVRSIGTKIFAGGALVKGAMGGLKLPSLGDIAGSMKGATAIFEETGTALARMSERTGIGVEALSQLKYAAGQSDVEIDQFEVGIKKMGKTIGQASIRSEASVKALRHIGLTAQDLINLKPEKAFELIADRLRSIPNAFQRSAAAQEIFGKQGTALLPMLNKGSAGIKELMQRADQLGLTMSSQDAEAAKELHEAMTSLWATLKGAAVAIGAALAPSLTKLAKNAGDVVGRVVNWIKENRGLIITVSTIATAVMAAGAAIVAVGYVIAGLGAVLGVVATVFTTLSGVLGGVLTVLGFILSPIGLIVAAVVGLGAYFLTTSGIVQNVVDFLSEAFGGLAEDFGIAFDAIKAALSGGDFGAAARVLWAVLKLEWLKGTNYINSIWVSAKTFFLEVWSSAGFQVAGFFSDAFLAIESAWVSTTGALYDAWKWVTSGLYNLWQGFVGYLASANESIVGFLKPVLEFLGIDVSGFEAAMQKVQADTAAAVSASDAEYEQEKQKRQTDRDAQLAGIQQERDSAAQNYQSALDEQLANYEKAKQDAQTKGTAEAEDALAKARAELADAAAAATSAKNKKDPRVKKAEQAADGVYTSGKADIAGTFSGVRLEGLGGPGKQLDSIASSTKENARINQEMLDFLQDNDGGLTFDN